jgi:Ca2+-binding EF-hand superfamily protein
MAGYYALKDSLVAKSDASDAPNPFALEGKFFIADTDRDGHISIHEMTDFLSKRGGSSVAIDGIAVRLMHADLNKDGSVSMQEYAGMKL